MMFTNSVVGLILAAALGHAALLPRKEGHTALHTYKGKFDCDDSHWLENPECCQEHFLFELYDECEPGMLDLLISRAVLCCGRPKPRLTESVTVERKDKTVVDPCVVGRGKSGKKPACCDVPEEERVCIDV